MRAQRSLRPCALSKWSLSLLAGVTILASTGCDKLKARDHMNQGVASFRNAKYNDAVEHFKQAAALEPDNPNARAYLATAYMVQWIPGADSPENKQLADAAKNEFMTVLAKDPKDKTALAYLASLSYNQAQSLNPEEKDVAAHIFQFLVTRSGQKVAHTAVDLADFSTLELQKVTAVLETYIRQRT